MPMDTKTTTILADQEKQQKRGDNAVNEKNGNGNERLTVLLERRKQDDALILAERMKVAKRKQKDDKKLFGLVGQEVCGAAERSPDLRLMIAQILGGAVTDAAKRRFLEARRYIA